MSKLKLLAKAGSPYAQLASAYLAGNFYKSKTKMKELADNNSSLWQALYYKGRNYLEQGIYKKAIVILNEVITEYFHFYRV